MANFDDLTNHIAIDLCTECRDVIWLNELWFTYKISGEEKRIHRNCMLKILAERIAEPISENTNH